MLMSPSLSPFSNASAENRIKSDDFDVLEDLTDLLSERNEILNSNLIPNLAEPKIEEISNSVSSSESLNPIISVDNINNQRMNLTFLILQRALLLLKLHLLIPYTHLRMNYLRIPAKGPQDS